MSESGLRSPSRGVQEVNEALDAIGIGPYQLVVFLLGGGIYAAEGSLLLMIGLVAKDLIIEKHLSNLVAGAFATIIFIGLVLGTIVGGLACDHIGRRKPILVTYIGIVCFLLVSSLSSGLLPIVLGKLLLGFFLGFGLPAANAIVCETCPATHRSNVYSGTMVLFAFGQMYSAAVMWCLSPQLDLKELNWRTLLLCCLLPPALLLVLSYFLLLESAHWLAATGRVDEARSTMLRMASVNGRLADTFEELLEKNGFPRSTRQNGFSREASPDASTPLAPPAGPTRGAEPDACEPPNSEKGRECFFCLCCVHCRHLECVLCKLADFASVRRIFSPEYRKTTLLMTYICFASNFSYYGMIYGLPHTLREVATEEGSKMGFWSPAAGVFFSAVFEIPGVFLAIILGVTIGRKINMLCVFVATALCLAGLAYALFAEQMSTLGMWCVFGGKVFIASGFIVVYLYLLEIYPTVCRATGLAFCMVVGRLGAFLCPFLFDGFMLLEIHYAWFFVVMAVSAVLASGIALCLERETKDAPLPDV